MPNKVKNILLLNTVLSTTLGILFVISPFTASVFSFAIIGIVLALSFFAKTAADNSYDLHLQRSSFMKLIVYAFIAMMFAMYNFVTSSMNITMALICFIMAFENGFIAFKNSK